MKNLLVLILLLISTTCFGQEVSNFDNCKIIKEYTDISSDGVSVCYHTIFSVPVYASTMGNLELKVTVRNKTIWAVWYGCAKCQAAFVFSYSIERTVVGFVCMQESNSLYQPAKALTIENPKFGVFRVSRLVNLYSNGDYYIGNFKYQLK